MAIGLATLRLDGFVSLEAEDKPGVIMTKPFLLSGNELEVNVDASHGKLLIELLDEKGKPIPGYSGAEAVPYTAVDDLKMRPHGKQHQDLAEHHGKIVRLKFEITGANLYSL